jgi:S-formylglutathione hydrolase
MTMQTVSLNTSYGGTQGVYRHASRETRTDMTFSVFVPPHAGRVRLPVSRYLSGCLHRQRDGRGDSAAPAPRLIFIAPDTSPRGDGVNDPTNATISG